MDNAKVKDLLYAEAQRCVGRILAAIEKKFPTMSAVDKAELKVKIEDTIHNSRRSVIKVMEEDGNG
jgi:hypothetical protein